MYGIRGSAIGLLLKNGRFDLYIVGINDTLKYTGSTWSIIIWFVRVI